MRERILFSCVLVVAATALAGIAIAADCPPESSTTKCCEPAHHGVPANPPAGCTLTQCYPAVNCSSSWSTCTVIYDGECIACNGGEVCECTKGGPEGSTNPLKVTCNRIVCKTDPAKFECEPTISAQTCPEVVAYCDCSGTSGENCEVPDHPVND